MCCGIPITTRITLTLTTSTSITRALVVSRMSCLLILCRTPLICVCNDYYSHERSHYGYDEHPSSYEEYSP